MALKLPRTIRLDPSDTFVYSRAAEPGEWAVTGTFMFFGADVAKLSGKARQAFRGGFLGIDSFAWSTLVVVMEASDDERATAVDRLAHQLVVHCGAPDVAVALKAAEEEVAFAESLCEHPQDTLVAIHRTTEDGAIREAFRTLQPRGGPKPLRAFAFLEAEDEEEPVEEVDLAGLVKESRK